MDNYNELKQDGYQENIEIRLKNQKKIYSVEYFDGVRIDRESLPEGKHLYHTRHADNGNMADPVTIRKEGMPVVVNFCGSIVSDEPINVYDDEVKLMYVNYV